MPNKCKRCSGEMIESKALKNDSAIMGVPDFPDSTVHSYGQTVALKSSGKQHDCLKCSDCGWSVTSVKE